MSATGRVWLVGAGPGDPELLTLKAARLLAHAEVVAYDELVSEEILALAPADAERIPVGRRAAGCRHHEARIHPLVIERALAGREVVRLKGGDPFLFGRGGEEAEELAAASIPFSVVPGISAAFGAAASAHIPLTHRDHASRVTFVTAHGATDEPVADLPREGTIVLYMGLARLRETILALLAAGRSLDTPAAVVASATTPREKIVRGTLATLEHQVRDAAIGSPALIIVGEVVAHATPRQVITVARRARRTRMLAPSLAASLVAVILLAFSATAQADDDATPKPKAAPYVLPFQLRPAIVASAVRSDTAVAFQKDPATGSGGHAIASMLLASYKVTPQLAPFVRFGFVQSSPPVGDPGSAFVNPAFGATYALPLGDDLRLALFLGLTAPIGQGGGNSPDKATAAAKSAGIYARSAMDNAMFAVNDFTVFPGVDLAYVKGGLTVQVEATIFQLTRVRGADAQPDSSKTNFTAGLFVGYFVLPELSLGAELRHQRWLSTPKAIETDTTGTLRDTTSFAVGPRLHLPLAESIWFRPAIAYAQGIDAPMTTQRHRIVQLDLPLIF